MNDVENGNNGININHIGVFRDVIKKLVNEGHSTKNIALVLGVEEATLQQELQRGAQSAKNLAYLRRYRYSSSAMDKMRYKYYQAYYKDVKNSSSNKIKDKSRVIPPEMHKAICGFLKDDLSLDEIRAILCPTPQEDRTEKMLFILSRRPDIYPINSDMYMPLLEKFVTFVDGDADKVVLFREAIIENLCQSGKCKEARSLINNQIANEKNTLDISLKSRIVSKLNSIVLRREIGSLMLKKILCKESDKDDEEFLEFIGERLLQSHDVKEFIQKISLGRDYLGVTQISLADIYSYKRVKATTEKVHLPTLKIQGSSSTRGAQTNSTKKSSKTTVLDKYNASNTEMDKIRMGYFNLFNSQGKSQGITPKESTQSNVIDDDNMKEAISGFLDFRRDVNEIKPLVFVQGFGRVTRDRSRNMARVIGERADLYPLNPNDCQQIIDRYLKLVNGEKDKNRIINVINMVSANLCRQKKYEDASTIVSSHLIPGRDLLPEQKNFNRQVNEVRAKILAKRTEEEFLSKILNKVSDEDDKVFLQNIRKAIPSGVKEEIVWNSINLGKDSSGTNTINLGQIYKSQRIME